MRRGIRQYFASIGSSNKSSRGRGIALFSSTNILVGGGSGLFPSLRGEGKPLPKLKPLPFEGKPLPNHYQNRTKSALSVRFYKPAPLLIERMIYWGVGTHPLPVLSIRFRLAKLAKVSLLWCLSNFGSASISALLGTPTGAEPSSSHSLSL